jgi:transposase-like protein
MTDRILPAVEEWRNRALTEIKNRGVKDILIITSDEGIEDAIKASYPLYQGCVVHLIRNSLKHVSYKERVQQ